MMRKDEVIDLFGTTAEAAKAMGITRQAIYLWPQVLCLKMTDRVIGAAFRTGRINHGLSKKGEITRRYYLDTYT